MLSDGNGKSHAKVNGHHYLVSKEECIHHVHKRLGYHLGKVSALPARDNVRTGNIYIYIYIEYNNILLFRQSSYLCTL